MCRPYHHGDLRRALIDAALALIEEQGAAALTLREVARQVGVTHTAPYRHFHDKADLLASVAAEGFRVLRERMEAARLSAPDLPSALTSLGVQYVLFALEHTAHYRVMFGRAQEQVTPDHPTHQAGRRAFGVLLECISDCQAGGYVVQGDLTTHATLCWSTVHGLALLIADGRLTVASEPDARIAFIRCIVQASQRALMG